MYLRLMAENQLTKETTASTAAVESETSVCPDNVAVEKVQNGCQPLTEVNSNQFGSD
ncbi:PREDICTED: uncharacterized protein LOC105449234 [Wasmannia auropunctata]|uniref:uncharacterized protein LOC105449234 n=1 Tax=Wasmannia auropunctata TaxID=64793 RepID=UPI0005EEA57A|nr:PREDICTED: uncharacterized protein LOC105449234 [Wasmannia auropunctata]